MSTSPEDEPVNLLPRWLARHVDDDGVRRRLGEIGTESLPAAQTEAVEELRAELERAGAAGRGGLEVAVRERLEALALG